jgi:serine/threonine protein kinase
MARQSLDSLLREGRSVSANAAAGLIVGVLADLVRRHAKGQAHGAVDPAHVLVEGDTAVLAEPSGPAQPAFLPPEGHAGEAVGPAGDVFSAGAVLYLLLAGQSPFEGPGGIPNRVRNMIPPPPSQVGGSPAPFDAVVEKALAKRPEARFDSAKAFAEALAGALAAAAPAPAPPPPPRPAADPTATVFQPVNPDATVFQPVNPDATVFQPVQSDATVVRPAAPRPAAAPRPVSPPPAKSRTGLFVALAVAAVAFLAAVGWLVAG